MFFYHLPFKIYYGLRYRFRQITVIIIIFTTVLKKTMEKLVATVSSIPINIAQKISAKMTDYKRYI